MSLFDLIQTELVHVLNAQVPDKSTMFPLQQLQLAFHLHNVRCYNLMEMTWALELFDHAYTTTAEALIRLRLVERVYHLAGLTAFAFAASETEESAVELLLGYLQWVQL